MGVPSKDHNIQLVQIQPEARLASRHLRTEPCILSVWLAGRYQAVMKLGDGLWEPPVNSLPKKFWYLFILDTDLFLRVHRIEIKKSVHDFKSALISVNRCLKKIIGKC